MIDRFDLEQDIMECWNVTKDLENILDFISISDMSRLENQKKLQIIVAGLKELYEIKFNKTFDCFEKFIKVYCK